MANLSESDLVFSAVARCPCGSGLAYVGDGRDNYWDCAKIWLGTADQNVQHTAKLPFVFYEIKTERQSDGMTTRPKESS